MRALRFLLGLVAALAAHTVLAWINPQLAGYFDPFLILTVLFALQGNSLYGLAGGLAAGLTRDSLSRPWGFHGFADTIIGYGVARAAQKLSLQEPPAVLAVIALATLLQKAVILLLAALLLPQAEAPELTVTFIAGLVNGIVGMVIYIALGRVGHLRKNLERQRQSRLR